jgi:hypothetical protein
METVMMKEEVLWRAWVNGNLETDSLRATDPPVRAAMMSDEQEHG